MTTLPHAFRSMTMRAHTRILRQCWPLAIAAATTLARATIPEPDAVVYGQIRHRFDQPLVPAQSGQLSLIAQVNGTTLATAELLPGTNVFLLRIPMDDGLEPRHPNTARAGDRVRLLIRNNQTQTQFECVQSSSQPWHLSAGRAPVVSMDLSVEGNVAGAAPDADGDGIADYWKDHFQLDPSVAGASQDADGDGVSNLEEYIAGTDPTDASSKFTVTLGANQTLPQVLSLSFSPASADRSYSVLVSDRPDGPWVEQHSVRPAFSEPQTVEVPIPQTGAALFFRVGIR